MRGRRTFLSHFVLCLACAGASFFAYQRGVPQAIFANDASMMTTAIAALFVVTAAYLGWQAWHVDDTPRYTAYGTLAGFQPRALDADFGLLAERLSVALGLVGTAIGLYLQAKAAPGEVNFTALVTMGCGVVGYVLIAVLTFSLESGIKRSAR